MGKAAATRRLDGPEMGRTARVGIDLLPVFHLHLGEESVDVPAAGQRLLAFLAVHGHHAISRLHAAGTLWPETTDGKAAANLRSTLWRTRRVVSNVIEATADGLRLAAAVDVDVLTYLEAARRPGTIATGPDVRAQVDAFSSGLLEDWYDGWLDGHRERWRLTRLCALEAIALEASEHGHYAVAVEAAFAAIRSEPLRETAHAALIEAHLAAGNVSEAAHHYDGYAATLADELGVRPSWRLRSRVRDVLTSEAVTAR
jgi:DNA-binding SARP family transcriptional activator